jgi:hypothetical protein
MLAIPFLKLKELCNSISEIDENIQSVVVINKNGRAIEKNNYEIANKIPREKYEMFFMQRALEISMGRDFDDEYGQINYAFTERENLSLFSFPINDFIILVISKSNISPISTAKKIINVISSYTRSTNLLLNS